VRLTRRYNPSNYQWDRFPARGMCCDLLDTQMLEMPRLVCRRRRPRRRIHRGKYSTDLLKWLVKDFPRFLCIRLARREMEYTQLHTSPMAHSCNQHLSCIKTYTFSTRHVAIVDQDAIVLGHLIIFPWQGGELM
jgi:hypothetical protein